jgi:endogenous inhibitor of DNA gyrase (YacG/DUF329 family)
LIDLGRWLKQDYAVPAAPSIEDEESPDQDDRGA